MAEQPSSAHVLARFAQIQTLRFMSVGVVALGFALLGWGLSINLQLTNRFGLSTIDRGLLLAIIAVPGVCITPLVGAHAARRFGSRPGQRADTRRRVARGLQRVGARFVDAQRRAPRRL